MSIGVDIIFMTGVSTAFTLLGGTFLLITSFLAILGIFKNSQNFAMLSFLIIIIVFIFNQHFFVLFPIDSSQEIVLESAFDKIFHNFGLIFFPLIANLIGFYFAKLKTVF